jgi:hypothetical protein
MSSEAGAIKLFKGVINTGCSKLVRLQMLVTSILEFYLQGKTSGS